MKKIFFVCLLFLSSASLAFAKFDPAFTWTTLETPHFYIHYHQGGEEIAKRTAVIAEDVHARLVPRVRWEPDEKTHLVLVDAMDETNGLTTVFPYPNIILFLTQPIGEPEFGTTPYEEWMRVLLTHEYTHVLQLDMVNGGYGGLFRTLFGRSPLSFPNALQPTWLIEGLAVYEETAETGGGRGRSAWEDMILRTATLEGPFPPISQMATFPDTWPAGDVPYLFGDSFIQFIADKYGRDKLADLSFVYSGRDVPFLVNSTAKRALGSYYGKLLKEWKEHLRDRYTKQQADVTAKGLTQSTPLTHKGYETLSPVYSPDGRSIAYLEANGDEFPGIYVMNRDGGGERKLVENVFPTSSSGMTLQWSPDSRKLYYTKAELQHVGTDLYDDIYYYDLDRYEEVRVTDMLRGRDPSPSADGRKLVFVQNKLGKTRLGILDLTLATKRYPLSEKDVVFLNEPGTVQYEAPRWSPDGGRIAVSVWQPGGIRDIWILDAEGKKLQEMSPDRSVKGMPSWSPDGKYLYFTSDRTGIYNLFAYEIEKKQLFQVTNVLGGAFSPSPSPDGKSLVFTSYSAKGYDVQTIPIDVGSWKAAGPYTNPYPSVEYREPAVETTTKAYNPLPTLFPRYWLPSVFVSPAYPIGLFTSGADVLQRHEYSFLLNRTTASPRRRLGYSFDYAYDGLAPTFLLHASDEDETFSDMTTFNALADYTERQKTYRIEMDVPLFKIQRQHVLTLGYQWKDVSAITNQDPFVPRPAEGVLASGRVSYIFNNSRRYNFSISPEQGRTIELGYERFDKSLGSDFEFNKYTADWHEYINFPWPHTVLLARAFVGTSTGERIPQGAFQLGGDNPGDAPLSIDDRAIYLRGYPANEFRGQSVALASLEYRFPIVNIERGGGQTPFFFRRLHGAVFGEAGNAWDGTFHGSDAKRAVGTELRMDMDFAYSIPLTVRLVFAKGLDEQGESQVYIAVWVPFGL